MFRPLVFLCNLTIKMWSSQEIRGEEEEIHHSTIRVICAASHSDARNICFNTKNFTLVSILLKLYNSASVNFMNFVWLRNIKQGEYQLEIFPPRPRADFILNA
jgi:hypothetical protein